MYTTAKSAKSNLSDTGYEEWLATQAVREHEQLRMKLGLGSSNSSGPHCGVEEGRWVYS